MADQLSKLRPDRDLQCYFLQPTAVAALSQTSASGFTVSGSWRDQFDWAVLEWNRDNVFEHPALRNLPDGDLSGISLSYDEARTNCIPMDSTLYPTVDWPYLRVWADVSGVETLYQVPLSQYATAAAGPYRAATVMFELQGTVTPNDYVELAWLDQHFNAMVAPSGDTLSTVVNRLAYAINNPPAGVTPGLTATANGTQITLTYVGAPGSNGNRIGVYGTAYGATTESWAPASGMFTGGTSPTGWSVALNFGNLTDVNGVSVPTTDVRKLRWTWSADMQPAAFQRSEFSVTITNWTVSGSNTGYQVAGPGSRRIEDDAPEIAYQGTWVQENGNYSGGSMHWTVTPGDALSCTYTAGSSHLLYLGTQRTGTAAQVTVQIDAGPAIAVNLALAGEDVLVRLPLGTQAGQTAHTVTVSHAGTAGEYLYFDFLEAAVATAALPTFAQAPITSLATDWDTLHSQALAPERTAWLMDALGFQGRANHYAGALWFYDLLPSGLAAASGTITFAGAPEFGQTTQVVVEETAIAHLNLIGDTPQSIAQCFALLINAGSNSVWAEANNAVLTITARSMGAAGNAIAISAATGGTQFTGQASGATLSGGSDGNWVTDLTAMPRLNRAARDWSASFFQAMKSYGIALATSFSMELGNGDDTVGAGIAQRYPDGSPVWVNTPALQTNFGPQSTQFWQQAYADMAGIMAQAGVTPYLQFGEVQWWYFASAAGMPFYDAATTSAFQAAYGRPMGIITSQNAQPAAFSDECAFLPQMIGEFTAAIMAFVRQTVPAAIFEVLYPPDVNDTALDEVINFPTAYWTPGNLACLKTENFTYTGDRNLDAARQSIQLPQQLGFPAAQRSHLVGISDYTTPWAKERQLAIAAGVESVVLFALDQMCLIGYGLPLSNGGGRALLMGG